MVFKQAVTAEDVFLGMGTKNPTTAACEDLVVSPACPPATSTVALGLHQPVS